MSFSSRDRVVFCALAYSAIGGIQRFNRRVARVLGDESPGRVTVHALSDAQEAVADAGVIGYAGDRARFYRQALASLDGASVLVIDHLNLLPLAMLAKWRRPGLRTLMFAHGIEVWDAPGFRRKRFYEPWMLRYVDRVAVVSQYTAKLMQQRFGYPAARMTVFPNAVDPLPMPERSGSAAPVVLCVTRLGAGERSKHVDKLVRAMPAVLRRVPGAVLEIIGDGVLKAEYETLARELDVEGKVRFLGRVSDEALDEAYGRAAVFALPSTKEGFGIVYLEAWLRGLPVVGGRGGAVPEVVADGIDGLLVTPDDIDAVAAGLIALLSEPEYARRLAEAGLQKVQSLYLHEHFAANLTAILRSLRAG